jgi:hypothetical protein
MSQHRGKCFCDAVEFEVSGEPVAMGYCHCEFCRHWSAGPVNAFTLWKPDSLKILKGDRDFQQDSEQLAQVVQEVWWTHIH